MNLDQLGKRDSVLKGLLQQLQYWQRLDREVKNILPSNLRPYVQTACIADGCLVLLAANNMASSRLKMILPSLLARFQVLDGRIGQVRVKVVPRQEQAEKANSLTLSDNALAGFEASADKLHDRHPELARALADLVRRHKP